MMIINLVMFLAPNVKIPTCRWCEKTVSPEECYADMVVDGHDIKWVCGCGMDVTLDANGILNGIEAKTVDRTT